jgi:PKD repeat protein
VTASATFSDPGLSDAPFTCAVNYGDGSGDLAGSVAGNMCTGPAHPYTDNGVYTVTISVMDKDSAVGANTRQHTVDNVAPAVNTPNLTTSPSNEGSTVTANAIFSDPGLSDAPFTCTVNYGDGSGNQAGAIAASTCTGPAHIYVDNGTYTVTVTVTDKDSASGANTRLHTVNNVAPSVATTGPYSGIPGQPIAFSGSYTDPGALDTHAIVWSFGDGITSTLQSPSHIYASAGVFTATLRVTDKDGGVGIATTTVTVRYVTYLPTVQYNFESALAGQVSGPAALAAWIERAIQALVSN